MRFAPCVPCLLLGAVPAAQHARDLAGKPIDAYPHFQFTRSFNEGDAVQIAFDPRNEPSLALRKVDVYLIEHEALPAHLAGAELASLTGAPLTVRLERGGVQENTFVLDPGTLPGAVGPDAQGTHRLGKGYDIVVDIDRDGFIGTSDLIDGGSSEAGFHVLEDYVGFALPDSLETGPYLVEEVLVDELNPRMDVYFPQGVAALGRLPLIVVSHGNGHDYRWYDHIGFHMASWGYVVMSHINNTGPGIETASTSTLNATELLLANLETIAGGALAGHVDGDRIVWMGHSRGGEGVVRAYRRLELGTPIATLYSLDDIKLVSSIAPTDFLGPGTSDMGTAPYHLWTGGGDKDVTGCADCNICQTFHLLERADGTRFSTSLHGVGHASFHAAATTLVITGPCRLDRPTTHAIMRAYLLPLVQYALDGNPACLDPLTRQWEEYRPLSAPDPLLNECVVVDLMYTPGPERGPRVIDDFQSEPALSRSSSGGVVRFSRGLVPALHEGRFDDANASFSASAVDFMNGMTLAGPGDTSAGVVLEWNGLGANGAEDWVIFEVPPDLRDLGELRTLSFRAAQATRHAITTAELGDLDFAVRLTDAALKQSTIRIGAYGGGIEEPYQRERCGAGAGWANEFETIRIPLADFRRGGRPLDLGNVVAITFLFGPAHGSPLGRIGIDDIAFTRE